LKKALHARSERRKEGVSLEKVEPHRTRGFGRPGDRASTKPEGPLSTKSIISHLSKLFGGEETGGGIQHTTVKERGKKKKVEENFRLVGADLSGSKDPLLPRGLGAHLGGTVTVFLLRQ